MEIIKKKIRDLKSIRILFVFDFFILAALCLGFNPNLFLLVMCIFLPLLLLCILLQLILYFVPKGVISFEASGITIRTKNENISIGWEKVECIYYNPLSYLLLCMDHFTIDLRIKIGEELVCFDHKFGDVKIYEKEYLNIISLIPHHILKAKDLMIYRNMSEKEKNKYNI